jgi:hypothetical protein
VLKLASAVSAGHPLQIISNENGPGRICDASRERRKPSQREHLKAKRNAFSAAAFDARDEDHK